MYIIMKTDSENVRSMVNVFDDWKKAQDALETMKLSYTEKGYGYSEKNGCIESEYQIYELQEI